jgi:hypothetical protein
VHYGQLLVTLWLSWLVMCCSHQSVEEVHRHACTHACRHTHACAHACTHTHTHADTHVHTDTHACTHTHRHVHTHRERCAQAAACNGVVLAFCSSKQTHSVVRHILALVHALTMFVLCHMLPGCHKSLPPNLIHPTAPQAVALHLLSALLAADTSSTTLADALHRADVPRALLESVTSSAPNILLAPAHKSQAALLVIEAQLSLLLALTAAGGPAARRGSTKAVADAGALSYLQSCKALDFAPEQPSSHQRLRKSGALRCEIETHTHTAADSAHFPVQHTKLQTQRHTAVHKTCSAPPLPAPSVLLHRYRLVHVVCPVLRLVLALLAGASNNSGLSQQAAAFASAHVDLLARLLQEAAAPGVMMCCAVCSPWPCMYGPHCCFLLPPRA